MRGWCMYATWSAMDACYRDPEAAATRGPRPVRVGCLRVRKRVESTEISVNAGSRGAGHRGLAAQALCSGRGGVRAECCMPGSGPLRQGPRPIRVCTRERVDAEQGDGGAERVGAACRLCARTHSGGRRRGDLCMVRYGCNLRWRWGRGGERRGTLGGIAAALPPTHTRAHTRTHTFVYGAFVWHPRGGSSL